MGNQYFGIGPDDERMAPHWALAEELDIPVAIHMGEGPPGAAYVTPTYRARLTSPFLLEEVLLRHQQRRPLSPLERGGDREASRDVMWGSAQQGLRSGR